MDSQGYLTKSQIQTDVYTRDIAFPEFRKSFNHRTFILWNIDFMNKKILKDC